MKYSDYYAILGLDKSAADQDIRRIYRKLAKQYHPDTHPNDPVAEKKFKEINEAYEVLSDKDKRARYDQLGADWDQYGDLGDIFSAFDERPGARKDKHRVEFGSQIFDLNFSDFFETFFGDSASSFWKDRGEKNSSDEGFQKQAHQQSQQALEYSVEISLEESLQGTKRRIQMREDQDLRTIEVSIPAGVKDSSKVRVNNELGEFYLLIKLKKHPIFSVDGNSLRCSFAVMDYEAILGCTQTLPTLSNPVQIKIPSGSQPGQIFRIRKQGLPDLRSPEQRGDILATLDVKVSKNLSPKERALIEEFRSLREG